MRVLISGFEPFGGRDLNPTAMIITALQNNEIIIPQGLTVEQVLLPVTFEESFLQLNHKIEKFNPDVVIALGMAATRANIELETTAINSIDAEIQDNNGSQPRNELISKQGEEKYFSTLPIQGIETALKNADIPVVFSQSAGTYVCNYVFYRLMETNQETLRLCGFIHVPQLQEQAKEGQPSLGIEVLKKAISVILHYVKY